MTPDGTICHQGEQGQNLQRRSSKFDLLRDENKGQ